MFMTSGACCGLAVIKLKGQRGLTVSMVASERRADAGRVVPAAVCRERAVQQLVIRWRARAKRRGSRASLSRLSLCAVRRFPAIVGGRVTPHRSFGGGAPAACQSNPPLNQIDAAAIALDPEQPSRFSDRNADL